MSRSSQHLLDPEPTTPTLSVPVRTINNGTNHDPRFPVRG